MNLLKNPNLLTEAPVDAEHTERRAYYFKAGAFWYTTNDRGELKRPDKWEIWVHEHKMTHSWDAGNTDGWVVPEVKLTESYADNPKVYPARWNGDDRSVQFFKSWGTTDCGLFQTVEITTPGKYNASCVVHAWSSNGNQANYSDGIGAIGFAQKLSAALTDSEKAAQFQIGIDPTGGTNPFAGTVVWSEVWCVYNKFRFISVDADLPIGKATVFYRGKNLWRLQHTDKYATSFSLQMVEVTTPEPPPTVAGTTLLGVHLTSDSGFTDVMREMLSLGIHFATVKVCVSAGISRDIKAIDPTVTVIGRLMKGSNDTNVEGPDLSGDLLVAAQKVMGSLLPEWRKYPDVDIWEIINEQKPPSILAAERQTTFLLHCINIAEANSFRVAVPSHSLGTPEYDIMRVQSVLLKRLKAGKHALALHEYSSPMNKLFGDPIPGATANPERGPLSFRHRFWEDFTDDMPDVYITEFNMDPVPSDIAYWKTQLIWYINEAKKRPYLKGIHLFNWGGLGGAWSQFESSREPYLTAFKEIVRSTASPIVEPPPVSVLPVEPYDKHYNIVEDDVPQNLKDEVYLLCARTQQTVGPAATDAISWAKELLDAGKSVKVTVWHKPFADRTKWIAWMKDKDSRIEVIFKPDIPEVSTLWDKDISKELPTNDLYTNPILEYGWFKRQPSEITGITVHHTAGVSTWRDIALDHIKRDGGTPSIHYSLGIDADGTINRMTNFSTKDIHDAPWHDHTGHYNTHIAIALMGNLAVKKPTEAQLASLTKLIKQLRNELWQDLPVFGHEDFTETQCPGWSQAVSGYWKADLFAGLGNIKAVHAAPIYNAPANPTVQRDRMLSMGIKYCKVLYKGDQKQFDFIMLLKNAGITPVVRIYDDHTAGRNPNLASAQKLIQNGVTLIEVMNEPNIEWPGIDWNNYTDVLRVADVWMNDAIQIIDWGGRPAFPAMAPTDRGDINNRLSGPKWAERIMAVSRDKMRSYKTKLWLAVHVSPFNKPFDFAPVRPGYIDDFCFEYYKVVQEWFKFYFEVQNPLTISTEGGVYSPRHMEQITFPVYNGFVVDEKGVVLYSLDTWKQYTEKFYNYTQIPVCTWTFTDEGVQDSAWLGSGWYDKDGNLRLK